MKRTRDVFLRRRRSVWQRLPTEIKAALIRGVSDVERIRADIARSAKVVSMPLVRIIDAIWTTPERGRAIDGRATFFRMGGRDQAGVELPAPVAVCGHDAVIRAILVHEFAHCFYFLTMAIEHVDAGRGDSPVLADDDDVFAHEEHDRQRLCDPADWFSEADARAFAFWNDRRLSAIEERMLELQLTRYLPIEVPHLTFSTETLAIPDDVINHIRSLRKLRDATKEP